MTELTDKDIEQLLPFYVNGTLSAEEKQQVEERLASSDKLQAERKYLEALRSRIKGMSEDAGPGELGLARLKKEIHAASQTSPAALASNDNIIGAGRWWKPLAVAACVALVVMTTLNVSNNFVDTDSSSLQTASGGPSVNGPVLQIFFSPNATEKAIREVLLENGLNFIGGPSAIGFYRVEFTSATSEEAAKLVISKLEELSVIEDVEKE